MKDIKRSATICVIFLASLFAGMSYGYDKPYMLKKGCTFTIVTETGTSETTSDASPGATSYSTIQINDILIVIENCVITQNNKNIPVYEEGSSSNELTTCGTITATPDPIIRNQAAGVRVQFLNAGTPDIKGYFAVALYDSENRLAEYIEQKLVWLILPALSNGTVAFNSAAVTASPGTYRMCVLYKPENGDWIILEDGNGNPACKQVTVIAPSEEEDEDTGTVFDVVISLYNNPQGTERNRYEEIIRYWADGIYEQSNGAHKLGKVRFFLKSQQHAKADVIWDADTTEGNCGGCADVAGYGQGGHIYVVDTIKNTESFGYVLAHEGGHYFYTLYDEYRESPPGRNPEWENDIHMPHIDDTPVEPSIMNSQWKAVGGKYEWLNHSTQHNYQANTAQGRVYGKSGWEVLIQESSMDPRSPQLINFSKRKHYPALVGKEPTATDNWIKIELPAKQTDARNQLQIIWMDGEVQNQIQIVIDGSLSMEMEEYNCLDCLKNAKAAAKTLIDVIQGGKTAVGIISFAKTASQVYPVTTIPAQDSNIRDDIKNAIDNISTADSTAIYDAADLALSGLLAYKDESNANQVVFLLTDGGDNSSSKKENDIIKEYQDNNVKLITFGYGSGSSTGTLRTMADSTGGSFYFSPTTLTKIQQAFLAATAYSSESVSLANLTFSVLPNSSASENFEADSTLESLSVIVNYTGTSGDIALRLVTPGGTDSGISFSDSEASGSTTAIATVSPSMLTSKGTGSWSVSATNNTNKNVKIDMNIIGNPSVGRTYNVITSSLSGNTVTYPNPIVLGTRIMKDVPITGINLTATIETPDGTKKAIVMNDEGKDGDAIAEDGLYSAITGYSGDGVYTIEVYLDNKAGNAKYTLNGMLPSPDMYGNLPMSYLPPITENFTRTTMTQVTVQGYRADDHSDTSPTVVEAENIDMPGSIDFAGDVDRFQINYVDSTKNLVLRVTDLALRMNPVLTIYKSDGRTVLASRSLDDAVSKNGYVYFVVSPQNLDSSGMLFAEVRHSDRTAIQGTYNISAGTFVTSDMPDDGTGDVGNDDTGDVANNEGNNTTDNNDNSNQIKDNGSSGEGDTNCFIQTLFDR